jgi:hypothetical protein
MHLSVLDSLSLPGNPAKANEDAFTAAETGAVVMDGATGLGEMLLDGESDAAWVARFGAARLMAHLDLHSPHGALEAALRDTEIEFARVRRRAPREVYEIPFASMMLVTLTLEGLNALWFGDCTALVRRPGEGALMPGDAAEKRDRERDYVKGLAARAGAPAAAKGVRDVFLPDLRRARNRVNSEDGSWLFGPDARAARHANASRIAVSPGTIILLATDGFFALASDYACYGIDALLGAALTKGLAALGRELRAIEDADPEGARFHRFKKSDDATAVLLKVAA